MDTYFLAPNSSGELSLYNGTFEKSENVITRDRMSDASIVSNGTRTPIDPAQWSDQDSTITNLSFKTGESGTYVAGVATLPRVLSQTAEKFNSYLEHDGVIDMLERRKENEILDQDAIEQYEKHVKAIFQVGDAKTEDWKTVLGYPIEFVPVRNPYEAHTGDTLSIRLLLDGKPLANQLVGAQHLSSGSSHSHNKDNGHTHTDGGHTHSDDQNVEPHSHDEDTADSHTHTEGQQLRTNEEGVVTLNLPEDGIYYLRTISMTEVDTEELTHQSKWATLTFEVTHAHNASTHTHEHEEGIPSYVFWLGSIVIIGLLFFVFRKSVARG